ncbi:MAG: flippase-like domain-containing protein [Isosphaeraceae bacterium]|nr:flippase-like domain-containing protein [Isosphaeraceae bacterium]
MSRPRSPLRSYLINAILTLTAFGLLALAIRSNWPQIREVMDRKIDLRLFALAFGVYLVAMLLTFLRWFYLVRALGLPFRWADAMRLGFIGNVFNLVIPGAVGGDVIKAAFLCREQSRRTQAIASMAIDRIVGLLGLFVLAALVGTRVASGASVQVYRLVQVVWLAVAAGVIGLAILFTPTLYRPLERLFAGKGRLGTIFSELVLMASAYRRRIGTIIGALAISVGLQVLFAVSFYLVSLALFGERTPSLAQHLLMVPLVLFSTAVPLPFGALGLTEQVSAQLFALVNHPGGAVAMMGFRILMYTGGLVSIGVYLANQRQVRDLSAAPAAETPVNELHLDAV